MGSPDCRLRQKAGVLPYGVNRHRDLSARPWGPGSSGLHGHMAFSMLLYQVSGDWAGLWNGSTIFLLSTESWAAGIPGRSAGGGSVGPSIQVAS